jgi:hypothetical protein
MAKQIARILKTDMMADMNMPALAQLLQKMGRGKDKVLAHITKEEAKLLKKRGGAGTRNPETGLLEFADDYSFVEDTYDQGAPVAEGGVATFPEVPTGENIPTESTFNLPQQAQQLDVTAPPASRSMAGQVSLPAAIPASPGATPITVAPSGFPQTDLTAGGGGGDVVPPTSPPPEEKGLLAGLTSQDKMRLGLGGLSTGLAAILGQRGVKQAQQAATATRDIGKPYRDTGQALQASALRGELTPAGQQSLQAAQAQLAQGQERRGGVGAQQSATQLATLRQNLLDQQYKYGLQVAQIGDQYAARAITQGLTGDQQMAQLMMTLTGNLSSLLGGLPQSKPVTPASTVPAA